MSAEYDVLVVGAGIHGAGVTQAAAAAGWSVVCLEARGIAAGTSSRSSKLIHGGLRYLESGQFGVVRECLVERSRLLRVAPWCVALRDVHVPVYQETSRRPWQLRIGLSLYSCLGGFRAGTGFGRVPRRDWDTLDGLDQDGLQAVYRFKDAQTDDTVLTNAVMRSAQELGAELRATAELVSAVRSSESWRVTVRSATAEQCITCRAIVNAAGPWATEVLGRITPAPAPHPVELVQGAHLLVRGATTRGIYYLEHPDDGRAVFLMPWHGDTLVGTTEEPYTGDPACVVPLPREERYLRRVLHAYFPHHPGLAEDGVLSSFAGLRVLPAGKGSPTARSRETILQADDERQPRVLTIYGGKLTAYRATAERAVRLLAPGLPTRTARADTRTLALPPAA